MLCWSKLIVVKRAVIHDIVVIQSEATKSKTIVSRCGQFNPLGGSVSFVKRFEKRTIEDPLSVLKMCLPPNRRCSESAEDPVSSPPLNYRQSAIPVEGLSARIRSIQLETYSN
ncbi:hypothetical protein AVEN_224777-1 [Araneus ventricosus]|uniref:Uncharacterized protein n=1 Tax=Araneus ventricosus TaxID=182803 RepID=A0A4Y2JUL4_ARAVE|nr:hypothetical protein AVEN_224777-1 [Araneus ventricosus]